MGLISYQMRREGLMICLHRLDMPGHEIEGLDGDIILGVIRHHGYVDIEHAKRIIDKINEDHASLQVRKAIANNPEMIEEMKDMKDMILRRRKTKDK